jgi:hypothetical protein
MSVQVLAKAVASLRGKKETEKFSWGGFDKNAFITS